MTFSYWEEYGNPNGTPVVFVHGGPGGGIESRCHRFFDPSAYRIILFCQRGCDRSIPLGCLENNTTWDLVQDMETLRTTREVSSWVVFGGSWGSTLALTYAQKHPECVRSLILRGIFTVRKEEVDWFYERGGAQMLAPERFDKYLEGLPNDELRSSDSLLKAFHDTFHCGNSDVEQKAALAWSMWEGSTAYVLPPSGPQKYGDPAFAAVFARIEVCMGFSDNASSVTMFKNDRGTCYGCKSLRF